MPLDIVSKIPQPLAFQDRFAERVRDSLTKQLYSKSLLKASLTFKCMTEHLFADFSYSVALDTYL